MKLYYKDESFVITQGETLQVMAKMVEKNLLFDMILADLPYGTTSNKWDSVLDLPELWRLYDGLLKENGVIALTASQPFTALLITSNHAHCLENKSKLFFRHEWIWIKNRGSNFANTVREPMKEHESVLVFSRGKWTYNKQMQERTGAGLDRVQYNVKFESQSENYREFEGRSENKLPDLRVPSSWQKFNTEVGFHPTQKPVLLMEYLIKTYTNEGETILDNTCGSGTTLVASKNLNRKCYGIEQEEKYCEITKNRLSEIQ
jgi:site-specific DNA-methyltransferase (adenine-specific)